MHLKRKSTRGGGETGCNYGDGGDNIGGGDDDDDDDN